MVNQSTDPPLNISLCYVMGLMKRRTDSLILHCTVNHQNSPPPPPPSKCGVSEMSLDDHTVEAFHNYSKMFVVHSHCNGYVFNVFQGKNLFIQLFCNGAFQKQNGMDWKFFHCPCSVIAPKGFSIENILKCYKQPVWMKPPFTKHLIWFQGPDSFQ